MRVLGPEAAQTLGPVEQELRLAAAEIADPLWPEAEAAFSVRKVMGILLNGTGETAPVETAPVETANTPSAPVDLWLADVEARHPAAEAQAKAVLAGMRVKEMAARQFLGSAEGLAARSDPALGTEEVLLVRETLSKMHTLDEAFTALVARLPAVFPAADPAPYLAVRAAFAAHLAALGVLSESLRLPAQG